MKLYISTFLLIILTSTTLFAQQEQTSKYLEQSLPSSWEEDDDTFQQTLPVNDLWWKAFEDPMLDSLITVSSKQNYTVLMALNKIEQAKANVATERASYYPSLSFDGGWTKQQSSGNSMKGVAQSRDKYFSTSLSSSWEVDLFGSIRKRVKAEQETFMATEEDYKGTMVSLSAEVATAYINLRSSQEQLAVLKQNVESQTKVVNITEVRFNTGLASKLDVAQAKSTLFSTQASIPPVEADIIQYMNSLCILLGVYPQDLRPVLEKEGKLPSYMEPIGVGIPANLLRRRPDIRSAERQINANAASLGASKADWLPKFLVNASIGYESTDLKNLAKSNSLTYEIAPTISINLFDGGKLKNATRLAKAELEESINSFNETVLTAVQEVDNAMNSYQNSIKEIVALKQVVNQGQETFDLSLQLYKEGLSTFQNVLDAQRSLLSYQSSLVQARGNSLLDLIKMYQSLGGGWTN